MGWVMDFFWNHPHHETTPAAKVLLRNKVNHFNVLAMYWTGGVLLFTLANKFSVDLILCSITKSQLNPEPLDLKSSVLRNNNYSTTRIHGCFDKAWCLDVWFHTTKLSVLTWNQYILQLVRNELKCCKQISPLSRYLPFEWNLLCSKSVPNIY